jgi:hypothetical protein
MKEAIKVYIKNQLSTNSNWSTKALIRIYGRQTSEEQNTQRTKENNGVGFSGVDAEILSSFAIQILNGRTLSAKQMAIVFKKMPRYWRQIVSLIPADKMAEIEQKALQQN